jgi:serine/threonine protein kinase
MFLNDLNIGVIEFAHGGELNSFLKHQQQPIGKKKKFASFSTLNLSTDWSQRMLWTLQLASAIEYIHSKGIIHSKSTEKKGHRHLVYLFLFCLVGDIRCANILVSRRSQKENIFRFLWNFF